MNVSIKRRIIGRDLETNAVGEIWPNGLDITGVIGEQSKHVNGSLVENDGNIVAISQERDVSAVEASQHQAI